MFKPEIAWEHEVARLVALRKSQGITQLDLACRLECSPTGVHEWETCKRQPRISAWLRWRRELGLPAPWDTTDNDRHEAWRKKLISKRR